MGGRASRERAGRTPVAPRLTLAELALYGGAGLVAAYTVDTSHAAATPRGRFLAALLAIVGIPVQHVRVERPWALWSVRVVLAAAAALVSVRLIRRLVARRRRRALRSGNPATRATAQARRSAR